MSTQSSCLAFTTTDQIAVGKKVQRRTSRRHSTLGESRPPQGGARLYEGLGKSGTKRRNPADLEGSRPIPGVNRWSFLSDYFAATAISLPGRLNRNAEPYGTSGDTERVPPCASTMERQIARPIPMPFGLVV